MKEIKKPETQNLLIFALLLITVAAVGITIWTLFFREATPVLIPDHAPVAEEANAVPIPDDHDEPAEAKPGSGSVSLTYSNVVTIDLDRRNMELLFANPGRSNQDMVLQVVIQDTVIVQTDRITPGNQVTELELTKEIAQILQPGGYEGSFRIFYYDRVTGEQAVINTEIPISVTVVQ